MNIASDKYQANILRGIRFVRYCTTGLLNTAITYVIYAALITGGTSHTLALAVGYVCGMLGSYFINARWTFQSQRSVVQLLKFLAVNLLILGFGELSLRWILTNITGSAYAGQALNLVPTTLLGFVANQGFVFRTKATTGNTNKVIVYRKGIRIFWITLGLVCTHRVLILISAVMASKREHLPITLTRLFVTGYKHWDSSWYLQIARHGYTHLKTTAFWPMYPWTMRMIHQLTGLTLMQSGVLISFLCFAISLQLLGMLVCACWDFRTAISVMVLYAFCPTSYYFDSIYTESLFMALLLGATYVAHIGRFKTANVLAALAALTRNTGILILIVLVAERIRLRHAGWRFWTATWWKQVGFASTWILVAPLTLLGYCLWLKSKFGMLFPFLTAEKFWHRVYMPPWKTFRGELKQVFYPPMPMITSHYALFETTAFVALVYLLVAGLFMLKNSLTRYSWWLYSAAVAWITTTAPSMNIPDYLVSLPRYGLMIFPVFVYLARLIRPRWSTAVVAILFGLLLYVLSGKFFQGQWIA